MMRIAKGGKTAAVGLTLVLTVAACGGNDDTPVAAPSGVAGGVAKGGTLKILSQADFEHLDPARTYVSNALNASRLIIRTLTTFKSAPGEEGNQIVGDLAEGIGEASADGKTWTFKLKDNLKYEDGSPIVAADIKYGVERTFSDQLPEGPQYAKQYLVGGDKYKGPYVDPKGLPAIEVPDEKTIVFKLKQPVGDFNQAVTLPVFSPVPEAQDKQTQYDNRPFSSGPYKIETYQRQKSMVLVRNTHWDQATDEVRKAGPDRIEFTFGLDANQIDQRLLNDSDPNAAYIDSGGIQAASVVLATAAALENRRAEGTTSTLRYLTLDVTTKPLDDLKVRQAIQYAINKETLQAARGGAKAGGEIVHQILAPGLPGRKDFRVYEGPDAGDVEKAKALLAEAGFPNGFTVNMTSQSNPRGKGIGEATQEALGRVGIKVNLRLVDTAVYYTEIGKPKVNNGIALAGWGPDWPNASTVIPPLFDGRQIKQEGNQIFTELNDPAINAAIDAASAETDPAKQADLWGELDRKVMETGAVVPFTVDRSIFVTGSKVKGLFLHPFYGEPDAVALSVEP